LGQAQTRIQLCGRIVVEREGRRVEHELPGRQGRLLFAHLAVNRLRGVPRRELIEALWPHAPPAGADSALSALLSKLRRVLGADAIEGRREIRLALPPATWIDLEAAGEAIHRAESAAALGDWAQCWAPARVALHVARRGFLAGEDAPWVEDQRRGLEELEIRALECVARSGLGLGGPELASAERSGRALIRLAPFRESGHRYLIEALAAQGNDAEALRVYDDLRRLLHDELGAAPSALTQQLHRRLLV
jgi:DNA-binding SARP family transcriptional activator